MNARARLARLEREARRRQRIEAEDVRYHFAYAVYGGTPEARAAEAAAKERGEKIPCFDYGQGGGE